jgi:hypothetical protein
MSDSPNEDSRCTYGPSPTSHICRELTKAALAREWLRTFFALTGSPDLLNNAKPESGTVAPSKAPAHPA